jgi:hypothetical protein
MIVACSCPFNTQYVRKYPHEYVKKKKKKKTHELCLSSGVLIDNNSDENVNFFYCEFSHYIQQRDLNIREHVYRSAIINKRFVMSTSANKKKREIGMDTYG